MNSEPLTDNEIQETARLLAKLEPGFMPYPIFEQVARIAALPIIEFIPLRLSDSGKVQVLLIEREQDDPLWPGALHTPGTVIRATDLHGPDLKNWPAFRRIIDDELKGTAVGAPQYVGSIFHESKRGAEQAQLYWIEVIGEPAVGRFYAIDDLPEKLISSQYDFIRQAAAYFRASKSQN